MPRSLSLLALVSTGLIATSASAANPPEWTRPVTPFHIIGPVWYVGTEGLAAYLIRTRQGAILIDGTLAENADLVKQNLATLGVSPRSVRYILVSHAHFDHVGADAALKAATGARIVAGAGDKAAVEAGQGPGEYASGDPVASFPAVKVDRAVKDGDRLTLGGVRLTARITPGHTPGCTTWTMRVADHGVHNIAFLCSLTVAGNRLVGNRSYPRIVSDYRTSFARAAGLKADVILPTHPDIAQVLDRGKRAAAGDANAFVAPDLLTKLVADARADFDKELTRQRDAASRDR
jgi:glyoxylase-like metal-dependent hydrolase (beta-lactamase superfamily II)